MSEGSVVLARTRRWSLVLIAAAALLVPAAASALDGDEKRRFEEAGIGEEGRKGVERYRQEEERRRARRVTPEAGAERQRSRTAYRGRASEALALARQKHPQLIETPVWDPLPLPAGAEVEKFIGDYGARVKDKDGKTSVLDSTLPLRSDAAGSLQPVDLGLADRGDAFESKNPLVRARIGKDAPQGISLVDGNLQLRLDSARSSAGELVEDRIFFAGALPDTDMVVMPTPRGVQISLQVRSADAPERASLSFDLLDDVALKLVEKDDATARRAGLAPGSVAILQRDEIVGAIQPPVAWDADGEQIETRYSVVGKRIVVHFPHRSKDLLYPLLIDPQVDRFRINEFGNPITTGSYLVGDGSEAAAWNFGYGGAPAGYYASNPWNASPAYAHNGNLGISTYAGAYYSANSYGQWFWQAPRQSWIARADYVNVHSAPYGTCVFEGIFSMTRFDWEAGNVTAPIGTGPDYYYVGRSPIALCGKLSYSSTTHISDAPTPGNIHAFRWLSSTTGAKPYATAAVMDGAALHLEDGEAPTMLSATTSPTDWISGGNVSHDLSAKDPGLGMWVLQAQVPREGGGVGNVDAVANCQGRVSRCPEGFAKTLSYSTEDVDPAVAGAQRMPEGGNSVSLVAYDILQKTAVRNHVVKVDRTAPTIGLSDELATLDLDDSGNHLYRLHIDAQDGVKSGTAAQQRSGVSNVKVSLDGQVDETYEADLDCTGDSCPLVVDYVLDTDFFEAEGTHRIQIVATDKLGNESAPRTLTIRVPRDAYYANQVAVWKSTVESRVDAATPALPLTGPMPLVPGHWRNAAECEATPEALARCYNAGMEWGRAVRTWLEENLANVTTPNLPDLPTYEYATEIGTAVDLTRGLREQFKLARRSLLTGNDQLMVALTFHEPVSPATLTESMPVFGLQNAFSLSGMFEPSDAAIRGGMTPGEPASIASSVEKFYVNQLAIANEDIAELEGDQPGDSQEAEDIAAALEELRRFRAHLEERRPFVNSAVVNLSLPMLLATLSGDVDRQIKAIQILPDGVLGEAEYRALDSSPNSAAVANAAAMRADAGDAPATAATSAQKTCAQSKQAREPISGRARRTQDPNPLYYAPSRFKYDSVLGQKDGDHHMKIHRLRARWANGEGLAWFCGAGSGKRGVELEAMVYPDDDERWSHNWESNDADKYTQTNMPGNLHQDDIASGDDPIQFPPGNPFDKSRFPDFAILSQSTRAFKYRKLYRINFTTNEGETDSGSARAIYSAQATRRGLTSGDKNYCLSRARDYKSCMVSETVACYDHKRFSDGPDKRVIDWAEVTGSKWHRSEANREHDSKFDGPEVVHFCDPRPPGSSR